jgi:hypothetical protein
MTSHFRQMVFKRNLRASFCARAAEACAPQDGERVVPRGEGGFDLRTSEGAYRADAVVAASGTPGAERGSLALEGAGIAAILWCIGFRPDFRWLDAPAFNGAGRPKHVRGVTPCEGVYFLGLPWLHTWGSGRFSAVGLDALYLADHIEQRLSAMSRPSLALRAAS